MAIGELQNNKLLSLALQGYNPFQPDIGIMCGGYQGPLYPNPTTLSYPGFDPYNYLDPVASEYTPDKNYTGLTVGDPGIDYKNPGHLLGLLDTFSRMAYGISMWQSIYAGNDIAGSVTPAATISIPIISMTEEGATSLGPGDIYPSLCEVPSDWLDGFSVSSSNGRVTPDSRRFVSFAAGGYTPTFNDIDAEQLNLLFADKTVLSYYGMPQYLRAVIEALHLASEGLATNSELAFSLNTASTFNTFCHYDHFLNTASVDYEHYEISETGRYVCHCKVLSPSEALNSFRGYDSYHDGDDGMNEYRSLTELNSVINLVPVQTVCATYWTDINGLRITFPPGGGVIYEADETTPRAFTVCSYAITDVVLNISDIPPDPDDPQNGTVTIAGTVTVKCPVSDPTAYDITGSRRFINPTYPEPGLVAVSTHGAEQTLEKDINIAVQLNNKFSWDRTWLGGSEQSDTDDFADSSDDYVSGGSIGLPTSTGLQRPDYSDLVLPFSKEFTLSPGCNTLRMRIFARTYQQVGNNPAAHGFDDDPDDWVQEEGYDCIKGVFIWQYPGTCYAAGTHYVEYSNPDSVPNNLTKPDIEVSFTITGTNMDTVSYNFGNS